MAIKKMKHIVLIYLCTVPKGLGRLF